jgi:hypothetical protein
MKRLTQKALKIGKTEKEKTRLESATLALNKPCCGYFASKQSEFE